MHSSCFNCILFVPILSIEYSLINQRKEWYIEIKKECKGYDNIERKYALFCRDDSFENE